MPSSYAPIVLTGAVGPGFANDPEDLARLGAGIEARTGVSPFARLADDGSDTGGLPPGYAGAIKAAQIVKGTDPDGVVLPDGATLQALNEGGSGFAPLPKIKATIGSRGPNRPADLATGQAKLARVGNAPRVADPAAPGHRRVDQVATTKGIRAFQRANGLAADGFMNPNGPTERTLDAQIGRQQKALEAALDEKTQENLRRARSKDPAMKGISNIASAKTLAGRQIGETLEQDQNKKLQTIGFADPAIPNFPVLNTANASSKRSDEALSAYWESVGFARGVINPQRFARNNLRRALQSSTDADAGLELVARTGRRMLRRNLPSPAMEINQRTIQIESDWLLREIKKLRPSYKYEAVRARPRSPNEPYWTKEDYWTLRHDYARVLHELHQALRDQPGFAWASNKATPYIVSGQRWLRGTEQQAGFLPRQIIEQLEYKPFSSTRQMVRAIWRAVLHDPVLSAQFSAKNVARMRKGLAPEAPESQHYRGRNGRVLKSYVIHHYRPISNWRDVYDLSNLVIVTPLVHYRILPPEIHFRSRPLDR
jgi:hypothetical protein